MARRRLNAVLKTFLRSLTNSKQLADDAHRWSAPGPPHGRPVISLQRRDSMTELALLKAFLAWESFLEESFVLYLVGQKPPRGRPPHRYAFPPTQSAANEWLLPESGRRDYAEWANAEAVSNRAERFFRDGRPYTPVLKSNQNAFDEIRIIRNAIAHASASAHQKFEKVARLRLVPLPANLTVGGYLAMTVPGSSPPISFLESYFSKLEFFARQIVPA